MSDILVIGDLHFPFHHKRAYGKLLRRLKTKKFDYIIQIGDLYDQYAFSKYPKSHLTTPQEELKKARSCAEKMWALIGKYQKHAKKYQILGNHDIRILKRVQESLPEVQEMVSTFFKDLYKFKGVKTIIDPREPLIIKDIMFIHGYKSKNGDHTRFMHMNVVHGHRHRGEISFVPIKGKTLWELDCGYLADFRHIALSYSESKITNWTLGHAEIENGVPRFVPYSV